MKDLGTLRPDDTFVLAESINDRGEVVGFSCGPVDCRGFHWQGGAMTDLNSVIPADPPLLITNTADINSSGQIAVQACPLVNNTCDPTVQDFVAAVLTPSSTDDGPLGAVAEARIAQRQVILSENVRLMLQRRLLMQHFLRNTVQNKDLP
jgi:probable HAF family extracellular repeat protein